jgi:hypothetical protein
VLAALSRSSTARGPTPEGVEVALVPERIHRMPPPIEPVGSRPVVFEQSVRRWVNEIFDVIDHLAEEHEVSAVDSKVGFVNRADVRGMIVMSVR